MFGQLSAGEIGEHGRNRGMFAMHVHLLYKKFNAHEFSIWHNVYLMSNDFFKLSANQFLILI